jgi:hypothetical protein
MDNLEETIQLFRETLAYLVDQEKIRAQEIDALNAKIDAVNKLVTEEVLQPIEQIADEREYNTFKDTYGERLSAFDEAIGAARNELEYDTTKETFDALKSQENYEDINQDDFVNGVEEDLKSYVDNLKAKFGIPEDTTVSIEEKPDGEVEVKADTDGDGEEEVVASENEEVIEDEEVADEEVADEMKNIKAANISNY